MPRNRRSPGRPGPSVLPMAGGMSGGRQTPVFNPGRGRGPNRLPRTPETAPYADTAGPPPSSTLTPNVQAFAPSGPAAFDPGFGLPEPDQPAFGLDGGAGEGSALVDALLAEETPGPSGGPSGSPESDAALINAEQKYGTPGNETALSLATQSSALGSSPGASLADIIPGYIDPNASAGGLYTGDLLLKKLMQPEY